VDLLRTVAYVSTRKKFREFSRKKDFCQHTLARVNPIHFSRKAYLCLRDILKSEGKILTEEKRAFTFLKLLTLEQYWQRRKRRKSCKTHGYSLAVSSVASASFFMVCSKRLKCAVSRLTALGKETTLSL